MASKVMHTLVCLLKDCVQLRYACFKNYAMTDNQEHCHKTKSTVSPFKLNEFKKSLIEVVFFFICLYSLS